MTVKGVKGYSPISYIYFLLLSLYFQEKTLHTVHQVRSGPRTHGPIDNRTIHRTVQHPFKNPSPEPRRAVARVRGAVATARRPFTRAKTDYVGTNSRPISVMPAREGGLRIPVEARTTERGLGADRST